MPDDALRLATLAQEELDVARIVDVSPETLEIETTGTEDKIDSLLDVLRPYGVIEMVRTGRVKVARAG